MYSHAEGEELGRYRLGRLIGSGGMGEVYLARDVTLRRDVAVKFVTSAAPASDVLTRRLLQEARAVAAIDHPGICPVHDVGVDSTGRPYMVMQYVPGETLAARLARGPLPVPDALRTCAQIADALATAHRRGIIHRDLKPQNVMLTPTGQPKLLDFGIAKVLPTYDGASDTTVTSLTEPHNVAGTPAYMSPEQIQQQPLDGRSDLFSLGCIMFECLTGRRAFEGKQSVDVLGQVLHVQSKAPSTLRPELDPRHDELCRRLLAKDPTERFQSAEEVVGALRLLQPDISAVVAGDDKRSWVSQLRAHWTLIMSIGLAVIIAGLSTWAWKRPRLPTPPSDAAGYYQLGTDALREGAFHSAAVSLTEAVRLFPNYALAYARLAEAHAEMDDDRAAAQDLVRVSDLVPDTKRLSRDEQLRVEAIRALVLAKADAAVAAYRELAARHPQDAGAWVDLARAQEAAGQLNDARTSLERAVAIDQQYAAARLRLGIIDGFQGRKDQALLAFTEAERLYRAASNKEGEAEVLLRRGALLNSAGDFAAARDSLERARAVARTLENPFQIVRADMQIGSCMVSEGRSSEAEEVVANAVKTAREAGLETVAADGLIDLASALLSPQRLPEAEAPLRTALALAEKRGAHRTVARAQTQLASVLSARGANPADVLRTLDPALAFFKERKYRKLELTALSIAARAYQDLDDFPKAHELASRAVKEAEASGDDYQLAIAFANLSSQEGALGSFPEALVLRERAQAIHRRQNDAAQLVFDLTNRAELFMKLGRFEDADAALAEIDDGVRKGIEVYVQRQRRVAYLRALAATMENRFSEATSRLAAIPSGPPSNSTTILAAALSQYVASRQGRSPISSEPPPSIDPATARERQYWIAAAMLARGDEMKARATAEAALAGATKIGSDELAWRLAAVGSAAARGEGNRTQQHALRATAVAALGRLRSAWGDQVRLYLRRPDLIELRKASELED
jgi:tetratricopeptide (TPR) repeat protein